MADIAHYWRWGVFWLMACGVFALVGAGADIPNTWGVVAFALLGGSGMTWLAWRQAAQEEGQLYRLLQSAAGEDLVEELSEAAHNAWLEEKRRRGVTTWPNERGFEQMVPYADCPEDVKEFDRVVIRAVAQCLLESRT